VIEIGFDTGTASKRHCRVLSARNNILFQRHRDWREREREREGEEICVMMLQRQQRLHQQNFLLLILDSEPIDAAYFHAVTRRFSLGFQSLLSKRRENTKGAKRVCSFHHRTVPGRAKVSGVEGTDGRHLLCVFHAPRHPRHTFWIFYGGVTVTDSWHAACALVTSM
jgi:hypothetical protein